MTRELVVFAQDRFDARVVKRIRALQDHGWQVTAFTFHRPRPEAQPSAGWNNIELGPTQARAYGRRLFALGKALGIVWKYRSLVARASALYVINADNGLLALAARQFAGRHIPFAVEIADIQPAFLRQGFVARMLRWLEGRILRRCTWLVTTSPAFIHSYFKPVHGYARPIFLLENKVYPSTALVHRRLAPAPPGPPWIVGYFGAFRCARSWEIIKYLARALPDRLEFRLRGFPSVIDADQFSAEVAQLPNIHFGGSYNYPEELPDLYGGIHFNWCFDFGGGANALWLLPNRIYEGGLFHVPALASANSQTGVWVTEKNAGWTFGDDLGPELLEFFRSLKPEEWQAKQAVCSRLPDSTFGGEEDYGRLDELFSSDSIRSGSSALHHCGGKK